MHFAFTDQQLEFRDAVRQVLAAECTVADLRAAYDDPSADGGRWTTLAELGVLGLTVPEEHGGLGLGLVDLVLLLEEAGRVALPEPVGATTGIAAPLLAELAGPGGADGPDGADAAATWLRRLGAGEVRAAVADPTAPPGRDGSPAPVAAADGADLLVLPGAGRDTAALHLVGSGGVTVDPCPSLDPTRRLARTGPPTVGRVAGGDHAVRLWRATVRRGAVCTAAELLGLADRIIDLTAGYAGQREQFGRPIGSFQAVKHLLAGARVRLEFARPAVYAAAWSLDTGADHPDRAVAVAKAYASEAAAEAARVGLQVHGAIGYTWECDLHPFLKRSWALVEAWGSPSDHRRRLLDSLLTGD